jgi:hypothetical protein
MLRSFHTFTPMGIADHLSFPNAPTSPGGASTVSEAVTPDRPGRRRWRDGFDR